MKYKMDVPDVRAFPRPAYVADPADPPDVYYATGIVRGPGAETSAAEAQIEWARRYAANGEISACPCVYSSRHPDDFERVTVRYRLAEGRWVPVWAYFWAHGRQGTVVPGGQLRCPTTDTFLVWVAAGSHASYPTPGTRVRCLGLANDRLPGLMTPTEDVDPARMVVDLRNDDGTGFQPVPAESWPWWARWFCICK